MSGGFNLKPGVSFAFGTAAGSGGSSAFGQQTSAPGSQPAFGSSTLFGQQQQPVTNATAQPTLGGFGAQAAGNQPTFGAVSATQSPMFGAQTGAQSMFGAQAGTQSMFGAQSGTQAMFGAQAGAQAGAQTGAQPMFGAQTGAPLMFGAQAGAQPMYGAQAGTQPMYGTQTGAQTGNQTMFGAQAGTQSMFGAQAGSQTSTQPPLFNSPPSTSQPTTQSLFGIAQPQPQMTSQPTFGAQPTTQATPFGASFGPSQPAAATTANAQQGAFSFGSAFGQSQPFSFGSGGQAGATGSSIFPSAMATTTGSSLFANPVQTTATNPLQSGFGQPQVQQPATQPTIAATNSAQPPFAFSTSAQPLNLGQQQQPATGFFSPMPQQQQQSAAPVAQQTAQPLPSLNLKSASVQPVQTVNASAPKTTITGGSGVLGGTGAGGGMLGNLLSTPTTTIGAGFTATLPPKTPSTGGFVLGGQMSSGVGGVGGGLSFFSTPTQTTTTGIPLQATALSTATNPSLVVTVSATPSTAGTGGIFAGGATMPPLGISTGLGTGLGTGLSAGLGTASVAAISSAALPFSASLFKASGASSATTVAAASSSALGAGLTLAAQSKSAPLTVVTTTSAAVAIPASIPAPAPVPTSMTYKQLEELINKWSVELEEQEKIFLQQATQVNAWDKALNDNGNRITQLNAEVERVQVDQTHLDQELNFILSQQTELEDILKPLEEAMERLPPIGHQQHADLEREHTYKMAENIDAQLKRMMEDLREIIEHLNANSTVQQDENDPMIQITKILNHHMDSLSWIDQNTMALQRRVEEVSRQADLRRHELDRGFRFT